MIEFLFAVKKFLGFWLMPLSMSMLLLTAGLLLLWFSRFQKLGKTLNTLGVILLFLASWQPSANWLLRPIEQTYGGFNIATSVDYIMVLGNLVQSDPSVPQHSHLSSSATARILEGVRIAKAQPHAKLIVSGYAGNNRISCAQAYADFAISMGIDPQRIIKFETPKDTQQEAEQAKDLVQQQSLVLVTSASHMPRAIKFFTQQAINVTAAPTFYLAKQTDMGFEASGLLKTERAMYEYLGMLWQSIKS